MGSLSTPRASIGARWLGPFVPLAPQICSFMAGTEHGGHAAPGGGISVAICHILGHQTSGVIPRLIPAPPNPPSPGEERQEKPPGISGSQLWERPSRTCRCCSAQCKNHMSRGSGSAARSSGAVPRGRGLGHCFFWRSDVLGNVCVALGPRGTDPSWKRRGIRAEDASPALIRNFPHL